MVFVITAVLSLGCLVAAWFTIKRGNAYVFWGLVITAIAVLAAGMTVEAILDSHELSDLKRQCEAKGGTYIVQDPGTDFCASSEMVFPLG